MTQRNDRSYAKAVADILRRAAYRLEMARPFMEEIRREPSRSEGPPAFDPKFDPGFSSFGASLPPSHMTPPGIDEDPAPSPSDVEQIARTNSSDALMTAGWAHGFVPAKRADVDGRICFENPYDMIRLAHLALVWNREVADDEAYQRRWHIRQLTVGPVTRIFTPIPLRDFGLDHVDAASLRMSKITLFRKTPITLDLAFNEQCVEKKADAFPFSLGFVGLHWACPRPLMWPEGFGRAGRKQITSSAVDTAWRSSVAGLLQYEAWASREILLARIPSADLGDHFAPGVAAWRATAQPEVFRASHLVAVPRPGTVMPNLADYDVIVHKAGSAHVTPSEVRVPFSLVVRQDMDVRRETFPFVLVGASDVIVAVVPHKAGGEEPLFDLDLIACGASWNGC